MAFTIDKIAKKNILIKKLSIYYKICFIVYISLAKKIGAQPIFQKQ